jgi:hypothetical protein
MDHCLPNGSLPAQWITVCRNRKQSKPLIGVIVASLCRLNSRSLAAPTTRRANKGQNLCPCRIVDENARVKQYTWMAVLTECYAIQMVWKVVESAFM